MSSCVAIAESSSSSVTCLRDVKNLVDGLSGRLVPSSREKAVLDDEMLTIDDLAVYMKLRPQTIYKWAQAGKIPGAKFGKEWRFRRSHIEAWIDERMAQNGVSQRLGNAQRAGMPRDAVPKDAVPRDGAPRDGDALPRADGQISRREGEAGLPNGAEGAAQVSADAGDIQESGSPSAAVVSAKEQQRAKKASRRPGAGPASN